MTHDNELILINISGQDKPGVTAALTSILARYNAMVLDIGQADIHHTLSLGILFKTTPAESGDLMKDLLFKAYDMGVKIRFTRFPPRNTRNGSVCKVKTAGLSPSSAVSLPPAT